MILPYKPGKQFHRRRPRVEKPAGPPPPPPPPPPPVDVSVVAVTAVGDGVRVDWAFDADVASVKDPGCLLVGPEALPPDEWEHVAPRTLRCLYAFGLAPGDGWYLRPDFGEMTFDPPGTLHDQDGTIGA